MPNPYERPCWHGPCTETGMAEPGFCLCRVIDRRVGELEAERNGLKTFIDKQAASVRALQRRLARAGLDASVPGDAERRNT